MRASNNLGDGLDEPIHLTDWNSGWVTLANTLGAELAGLLGREGQIEHVGSTAVEGMRAKPILDLMLGAADEAEQEAFAQKLVEVGWQDMGEAGVSGRRHLRKRSGQRANVHVVLRGSPLWVNNLAIRDFLCATVTSARHMSR